METAQASTVTNEPVDIHAVFQGHRSSDIETAHPPRNARNSVQVNTTHAGGEGLVNARESEISHELEIDRVTQPSQLTEQFSGRLYR